MKQWKPSIELTKTEEPGCLAEHRRGVPRPRSDSAPLRALDGVVARRRRRPNHPAAVIGAAPSDTPRVTCADPSR
jgi:hypothetical protein